MTIETPSGSDKNQELIFFIYERDFSLHKIFSIIKSKSNLKFTAFYVKVITFFIIFRYSLSLPLYKHS